MTAFLNRVPLEFKVRSHSTLFRLIIATSESVNALRWLLETVWSLDYPARICGRSVAGLFFHYAWTCLSRFWRPSCPR
jgi:hypothetical protein